MCEKLEGNCPECEHYARGNLQGEGQALALRMKVRVFHNAVSERIIPPLGGNTLPTAVVRARQIPNGQDLASLPYRGDEG